MCGTLYMVSVPIGNAEDITLRALRVLKEVDLIAAEDTRHTRRLLNQYDIHKPMISYFEHNEKQRSALLLKKLKEGKNIAIVPDSGTPGISDPGFLIVKLCIENGIQVIPVPGPSAILSALIVSGLPMHSFVFEGFLPSKKTKRIKKLTTLKDEKRTLVFFEAPHRLLESLSDMLEVLGDREISIANDLTKKYEEIHRGRISDLISKYKDKEPLGEFTIIVRGLDEDDVEKD